MEPVQLQNNETDDAYIQKCMRLANETNRLYAELETMCSIEHEARPGYFATLQEIETFFDELADRQLQRLSYVQNSVTSSA